MLYLSWCDLNIKGTLLKANDKCPNPKCKCQKQTAFTPKKYQLGGAGFDDKLQKPFMGTETTWSKFIKPSLQIATPLISAAVAAQTRNP